MLQLLLILAYLTAEPTPIELPGVPKEWPDEIRKPLERYDMLCRGEQGRLHRELFQKYYAEKIKKLTKWKTKTAAERDGKAAQLAEAKTQIDEISSGILIPRINLPSNVTYTKAGDVGMLVNNVDVDQIVDGKIFGTCGDVACCIIGADTSDLADDDEYQTSDIVECVGPQSYSTTKGGTRTLRTFRVIPLEKIKEWEQLRREAYGKLKQEAAEAKKKPTTKPTKPK